MLLVVGCLFLLIVRKSPCIACYSSFVVWCVVLVFVAWCTLRVVRCSFVLLFDGACRLFVVYCCVIAVWNLLLPAC